MSKDECKFLVAILIHYGTKSHDELVFLTHAEGPWSEEREGLHFLENSEKEISLDKMYLYYKHLLDE